MPLDLGELHSSSRSPSVRLRVLLAVHALIRDFPHSAAQLGIQICSVQMVADDWFYKPECSIGVGNDELEVLSVGRTKLLTK